MPKRSLEANLVSGGHVRITWDGNRIAFVDHLGESRAEAPFISPGFIDLQINGYAGLDFSDPESGPEDVERLLHAMWATGTTTFLPTLISNTPGALKSAFRTWEGFRKTNSRFAAAAPAYHLEGPFLSPGPSAGAHKAEFMKAPDWDTFREINSAAGHRIALLTLAPEWPGTDAFIGKAVANGIQIAVSHTDGKPDDIHRAAEAGASLSTHLGNGCPQMLDRHQAPFWAQLDDDRLAASLICDGFHLTPEMVRIISRVKGPERCLLVSDAVFVAGLEPGPYALNGKPIELLPSGQVVTADRRSMAGSTLDMAAAIGNYQKMTGCPLQQALDAATLNPARFLGIPGTCAAIAPGQPANLVLFHHHRGGLVVEETLLAGESVYTRSPAA